MSSPVTDISDVTVNPVLNPKTAQTQLISSSFDILTTGDLPGVSTDNPTGLSQLTAYVMGGAPSSTVNEAYRNVLEGFFALSQDTSTDPVQQAKNAIALVRSMMQLRESALSGSDYVHATPTASSQPTDPFVMDQSMVQTMDTLSILMTTSNLTPAKIIAWAKAAGIPIGSNPNPTSYTDIQIALGQISSALLPASMTALTPGITHPDLSFTAWQQAMSTTDNKSLLLTQIQSTFPATSLLVDTGDNTGAAIQTNFDTMDIDPGLVATYNQLIAKLNTIAGKDPTTLTRNDAYQVVTSMATLRTLANGVLVLDPYTGANRLARMTSPMLLAIDSLSRSLDAVGLVTSSVSALDAALPAPTLSGAPDPAVLALNSWIVPATGSTSNLSLAQSNIQSAQSAGATTGSVQSMIEVQYVNAGVNMLENQLTSLNQALVAVQNTAQLLGTLQQIHNYIDVTAPTPLALKAYTSLNDKSSYVKQVQQAIFDLMTPQDKAQAAALIGKASSDFLPSDINNPALFNGVPLIEDGTAPLTGGSQISTMLLTFSNAAQAAIRTYFDLVNAGTVTFDVPSNTSTLLASLFNTEKAFVDSLATLAYKTLPNANLDTSVSPAVPFATPVVPVSQINALRKAIEPFLDVGLDLNPSDVGGNSPQLVIYKYGDAALTTVPTAYSIYASNTSTFLPLRLRTIGGNANGDSTKSYDTNFNGVLAYLQGIESKTQTLYTTVSQVFNAVLVPATPPQTVITSSGQDQMPDPASYGIIGNLQWNKTDTDLGAKLNAAAGAVDINVIIGNITNIITTYKTVVRAANDYTFILNRNTLLQSDLNTQIDNLTNQGALTSDQQVAIKAKIDELMTPSDYFNRAVTYDDRVPGGSGTSVTNYTVDQIIRDISSALSTVNNPAFAATVSGLIEQFRKQWVAGCMAASMYGSSVNSDFTNQRAILDPIVSTLKNGIQAAYTAAFPTGTMPFINYALLDRFSSLYLNWVPSTTLGYLGVGVGVLTNALDIGDMLDSYLTTPYTSSLASGTIGIQGMFAERLNITPDSDPAAISSDTLAAIGLPTTPDFNLQSVVLEEYNKLSKTQKQTFIVSYLKDNSADAMKYAKAIQLMQGPNQSYPNLSAPLSVPIPAAEFAKYYLTLHKPVKPILTEADMAPPTLTADNFDNLAKQIYGMTIPPFIKLPAGMSMQDVLDKILNTRAQLAQQLSGLKAAQDQQKSATGSNSTPIVQYVTKVLDDLSRIPDPTSSTYDDTSASAALTSWILDGLQLNANDPSPAVQAAAANAGQVQTNLQTAITAATNMNGTQQQNFQQYMTVYSQFMQSASALLTSIMQIMQAFITGIK